MQLNVEGVLANNKNIKGLTKEEIQYLIDHVGHSIEEINELPLEVSKQLVKDKAVIVDKNSTTQTFYEPTTSPTGNITPMGILKESEISISGVAYKVNSDISGENKYYLYGNFQWLTTPSFVLVDKMTIGFPSSAGFYLPMVSGKVSQHTNRYSHDIQGNGVWRDYPVSTVVADWEPNAGVAAAFDLRAGTSLSKHKGYMGQYVYVPNNKSGKINVKVEYGHKRISGTPSVSVYPAGLSITPSTTVDTAAYGLVLSY